MVKLLQLNSQSESLPTLSRLKKMCEMIIPVTKVGLIIGKGGETIKRLEEQSGAKIVVIQVNAPAANEKPLRMFGSAESIEHAKRLVSIF